MIDVSIIVINFNTPELTVDCVTSILHHTAKLKYEIIIVDNNSDLAISESFFTAHSRIRVVRSDKNLGFSKGNNLGLLFASGEYILLLNSDTKLLNNAIYNSWNRIRKDNSIGALTCMLKSVDGSLQFPAERFPSIKTALRELFRMNKKLDEKAQTDLYLGDRFDHLTEREVDWVWGTFFLIPRLIIDKLGGKFPDYFFMYGEDVDWCWKIKKLGYNILYNPTGKVLHLGGASDSFDSDLIKYFSRMFPNKFKAVAINTSILNAWFIYFLIAIHHLSLRTQLEYWKAGKYLKFLFSTRIVN